MDHKIFVTMYRVYLLFSLVCLSRAQIPSFGFCPDYLPMPHFDMNRFLGKWYEAERYFQFSEVASRCVVTDYAVGPNGKIYVSNEVTNRFTGVKRVIGGNMDLTGKKTEGRLVIKYNTTPISTTSALTILDTDYETYAVIWSCSGLGPVNAQSAWLMTRERIPDATTLQKAYGVLDSFKISRTFFVKTDQAGCAIAASDLNAALGIASTSTNVDQNTEIDSNRARIEVKAQPVANMLLNREDIGSPVKTKEEAAELFNTDKNIALKTKEKITPIEIVAVKTAENTASKEVEKLSNESKRPEILTENLGTRLVPEIVALPESDLIVSVDPAPEIPFIKNVPKKSPGPQGAVIAEHITSSNFVDKF